VRETPRLCKHCGSLVSLDEKGIKLYKAAGFYSDNSSMLSRCAYCIRGRLAVRIKHELPRRIDASYPYGVISVLPGNTFTETEYIEPLKMPEARPGLDPSSPFAVLTGMEVKELVGIASWLCAALGRQGTSNGDVFDPTTVPRYSRKLCVLGREVLRDNLDSAAVRVTFDAWVADNKPKRWLYALTAVFKEAFSMKAEGADCETILQSLQGMIGL